MTCVHFSGRYEVYVNIDHFQWKQASQWSDNCIYIFQILPELQKQIKMAMPFQTDTTVSMSICKCQRTEKLRAKAQISQLAPNQPKPLRDCNENYSKVVWSITSSSQPKLSSPTTSKSSAVLFSAKFTSSILHLYKPSCTYMIHWLNTFSPSHKQTSRRGWDAWSTIGIRI